MRGFPSRSLGKWDRCEPIKIASEFSYAISYSRLRRYVNAAIPNASTRISG
jgi:hypothetical protein